MLLNVNECFGPFLCLRYQVDNVIYATETQSFFNIYDGDIYMGTVFTPTKPEQDLLAMTDDIG